MDTNLEALKKLGKLWEKNGNSRIYFNYLEDWIGLECEYYNTGNINHAKLNGERISNSEARRIQGRLADAKVWYDIPTGKFMGKAIQDADFQTIVAAIRQHAASGEVAPAIKVA